MYSLLQHHLPFLWKESERQLRVALLPQSLEVGQRAHGYVTGAKDYGVFVGFCGGVKGLVPLAELGLEPNQDPSTHFPVGQAGLLPHSGLHQPLHPCLPCQRYHIPR